MKKEYKKPTLELITARVEKGFAGSGYISNDNNTRPGHGWGDKNHDHTGNGNGYGHYKFT